MGAKSQPPTLKLGVDGQLADRALRALLKHHESGGASAADGGKEQLLGDDVDVQVQFGLVRVPGNPSPKPVRIEVPHPLVRADGLAEDDGDDDDNENDHLQDADVCLIVKEESKPWVQEMVSRFPSQLGCVKKVLGLQSLRTKHKSFAQRRELLARFDVFMADDRILPMLTKALGVKFFEKKKQPIPVKLTREEALPFAVQRCLRSTFMYLGAGTCLTVKAGNTAMPPEKLLANIKSICAAVPQKVPRKWSNVRSVSVKTSSSVALPIYNKTPEELEQLMKMAKEGKLDVGEKADDDVEDGGKKKKKRKSAAASTPLAKALKRQKAAEADAAVGGDEDEVAEKPKKSSKKKRKESVDAEEGAAAATKTPKSSKKKRKESIDDKDAEDETATATATKTPKSSKKKRKEAADAEDETTAVEAATKTPKSSKKKRKESIDSKDDEASPATATKTPKSSKKKSKEAADAEEETAAGATTKTPKSSKKKKSSKKEKKDAEDEATASTAVVVKKEAKTPKSSKKSKDKDDEGPAADANFIFCKKFEGAKKGYVFRKSKLGIGYHKDAPPVVDMEWRANLGRMKMGGRKSMGLGTKSKRKGGGRSRRSY